MKFKVTNIYPKICKLTGKISLVLSITNVITGRLFKEFIFVHDTRLLLLQQLEFSIQGRATDKKITNLLLNKLNELTQDIYVSKAYICPICNSGVFSFQNDNYCTSISCVCNGLEETIFNQINQLSDSNVNYDFFKSYIFNSIIEIYTNNIDILYVFKILFNKYDYFQSKDKSLSNQDHEIYFSLMHSFVNMKPSTFFNLCKCPQAFKESIDNLDNYISDIDQLNNTLSTVVKYNINLFPSFFITKYPDMIIDDKRVEDYIKHAFIANCSFITDYLSLKNQILQTLIS